MTTTPGLGPCRSPQPQKGARMLVTPGASPVNRPAALGRLWLWLGRLWLWLVAHACSAARVACCVTCFHSRTVRCQRRAAMSAGELFMPKTWWGRLPGVGQQPLALVDLESNASIFQEARTPPLVRHARCCWPPCWAASGLPRPHLHCCSTGCSWAHDQSADSAGDQPTNAV